MKKVFIFFMPLCFLGCFFSSHKQEIFSHPRGKVPLLSHEKFTLLPLFSHHGLQEGLDPKKETLSLGSTSKEFKVGGASILSSYLQIIKQRFKNKALIISTGKISHPKDDPQIKSLKFKIMEKLPFDSVLYTGEDYLSLQQLEGTSPYTIAFLNSNLLSLKTQEVIKKEELKRVENLFPFQLIEKQGIKIGLMGLTDIQTLTSQSRKKLSGVYFQDLAAAFLKFKHRLRSLGAQVFILLSDIPTQCQAPSFYKPKRGSAIPPLRCPSQDPLKKFTERLPPNSLDLIVLSGYRQGSGRMKKILVLNDAPNGHFLSQALLYFDHQTQKILFEKTKLYPKTKICHRFFVATRDCHLYEPNWFLKKSRQKAIKSHAYALMPAQFLGFEIQPDPQILNFFNDKQEYDENRKSPEALSDKKP